MAVDASEGQLRGGDGAELGDGRALVTWVPTVLPEYREPWHLLSWCGAVERCLRGGVRALCAVPVRHWKTETTRRV